MLHPRPRRPRAGRAGAARGGRRADHAAPRRQGRCGSSPTPTTCGTSTSPTASRSRSAARRCRCCTRRATPRVRSASTRPTSAASSPATPSSSGGPGATGRSYSDSDLIKDSIRAKLFALPDDTVVHTGHGDDTTIGAEKAPLGAEPGPWSRRPGPPSAADRRPCRAPSVMVTARTTGNPRREESPHALGTRQARSPGRAWHSPPSCSWPVACSPGPTRSSATRSTTSSACRASRCPRVRRSPACPRPTPTRSRSTPAARWTPVPRPRPTPTTTSSCT